MKKMSLIMLMILISACAVKPIHTTNSIPITPISTDQTQAWNGQLLPKDHHCQAYFETAKFTLDKLNTEVGLKDPSLLPQRVVRIASIPPQDSCHVMLTYVDGKTAKGILSFDIDSIGHVTAVSWVADKDIDARNKTCSLTEKIATYIANFDVYSCAFPEPAALQQIKTGSGSAELMRNAAFHNYKPILRMVALQTCYNTILNKLINETPNSDPNVDSRLLQQAANSYQYYFSNDGSVNYSAYPLGLYSSAYLRGLNPEDVVNTAIQVANDALTLLNKNQSNPRKYKFIYISDALNLMDVCARKRDFILSN